MVTVTGQMSPCDLCTAHHSEVSGLPNVPQEKPSISYAGYFANRESGVRSVQLSLSQGHTLRIQPLICRPWYSPELQ
jgi:hypothetical protein